MNGSAIEQPTEMNGVDRRNEAEDGRNEAAELLLALSSPALAPTTAAAATEPSVPTPDQQAAESVIRAYARLEFTDGVDFYVSQLSVTIGRRPPEEEQALPSRSPSLFRPTSNARSSSAVDHEPSPLLLPTAGSSIAQPIPDLSLAPTPPEVHVDLGPLKAVSREHARLFYDYEHAGWALDVLGRNGVVVDDKWRARGDKVILRNRCARGVVRLIS